MLEKIKNIFKSLTDTPIKQSDHQININDPHNQVIIEVPYYSQVDNNWFSSTSCYATSMAMAMAYCLHLIGTAKTAIGCKPYVQLEDYISSIIQSKEIKNWIQRNVHKYGNWMLKYKPRTIAYVQEHVFNSLMKPFGFKTKFTTALSLEALQNHIDKEFPVAIHGDFRQVSPVKGHIVLCIGYNKVNNTLIVHDPFGNALYDKYKSNSHGEFAEYPVELLMRDKKNKRYFAQIISKEI